MKEIGKRIRAIAETTGARYLARVGILRDYDNLWDCDVDVWHSRLTWPSEEEIYIAGQISHTPMDYVQLLDSTQICELASYDLLFYPHPEILTQERADLLKAYVEQGGTLILGARTGQKDINGQCVMQPMPGLLSPVTGSDVEEYTFVGPADEPQSMLWNGQSIPTGIFSDILSLRESGDHAKILAVYEKDYYKGKGALIEKALGNGRVLHFGGSFTRENVLAFLRYTAAAAPFADLISLPSDCELAVKEKDGTQWLFALNYSRMPQDIDVRQPLLDLDAGKQVQGSIRLEAFETKVFRK